MFIHNLCNIYNITIHWQSSAIINMNAILVYKTKGKNVLLTQLKLITIL